MSRGLGRIQREILKLLEEEGADRVPVNRRWLTAKLATRLGRWQERKPKSDEEFLASLPEGVDPATKALLLRIRHSSRRQRWFIPNSFSASVSRALKGLERRGLVTCIGQSYVYLGNPFKR